MVWPYLKVFCHSKDKYAGHREKEAKIGRRRGGKTIIRSGQGWTFLAQLGQLKTGLGEKELL